MESSINLLFDSKNRRFEIPSYQRAYSWEDKQINQFIDDLKNAENQYYLGHFLFEKKENNTLCVIDGQQRLTTCIIFFSTIQAELEIRKNNGDDLEIDLDDLEDYYLKDIRKGTQKFKTVNYDNNFFLDEIIDRNPNHNHSMDTTSMLRIKKAKTLFEETFRKTPIKALEKWCGLIENATITSYIVKDKIQATQVFAFQNDRGLKLSNLEILKAFFMLQIYLSGNSVEKIDQQIEYLEVELANIYKQIVRINISEDEVLNYYWRSISGKGFYSTEVVKGVKETLAELEINKTDWIKEFISGLSQAFKTVELIEKSPDNIVKDLLYLNNMALAYPFIIKAYKIKASASTISRLLYLLENITFRYLLRGGRAEIESRLNHYLIHCSNDDELEWNLNDIIHRLKTNGWWGYWNDSTMIQYLNSGYFYKNRVDNYLLWKYELRIANKNHPIPHNLNFNDLIKNESIEHIAPQTPTDGDPVANGYGVYEDMNYPDEGIVSGNWLNCVGNLMLISQKHNSSIGNNAFKEKIQSYGEDNLLYQQKEICDFIEDITEPIWNVESIKKRHDKILDTAKQIWDLDKI